MPEITRSRSLKIHIWVNPTLLQAFEHLRSRLGFSRDGGIEHALSEYITKHKEDPDATTPHRR